MSLRVHYEILNQKGTPAFYSDTFANRPAFGFAGRVFISTDTGEIFEDTGSAWTLIADAGAGTTGTLQQVTTNGNSTNQGIIITAGNLGINTSSPGAPLDIHGTGTVAQFNGTGTNNAYVFFQNAGASKWRIGNNYNAGANSFDFYSFNAASIAASFNGNGSLLLNFNLGIKNSTGINQVSGYSNIAADSGGFYFNNGSANNAYLLFSGLTASRTFTFPDASGTLATTANLSSYLPLTGGTLTGNLIISKATATSSIQSTTTTNFAELQIENTTNYLQIGVEGASPSRIGGSIAYNGYLGTYNNYGMTFHTNNQIRMHLTNGGNLLIGTTTDNGYKLQVNGGIVAVNDAIYTSNTASATTYGWANSGAGTLLLRNAGVANVGSFAMATGVYTPLSDINKKKDFEISTLGLNAILNLKPTLYRMKEEDNTEKHLGFIAQEVKEFIPQAYIESGNFIGLDYQAIVATLVKSIQELNEKLVRNNIN